MLTGRTVIVRHVLIVADGDAKVETEQSQMEVRSGTLHEGGPIPILVAIVPRMRMAMPVLLGVRGYRGVPVVVRTIALRMRMLEARRRHTTHEHCQREQQR